MQFNYIQTTKVHFKAFHAHYSKYKTPESVAYSVSGLIRKMKANEMHYFSNLFYEVHYMFRTNPLSIIRDYLNSVYTTIDICHASSVGCLLAWWG